MPIAQSPRVRIAYGTEVTRGVTPANLNLRQLRCITRDINLEKATLASKELYPDRNRRDLRLGFNQVAAKFDYELSIAAATATPNAMDDMFESLLGGTWSAAGSIPATPGTLKVGTALKTYSFERQFLDLPLYEPYAGCIVDEMTLDFNPQAIIGGIITVKGMGATGTGAATATSIQGAGSLTNANTAPPCDVFLGQISEGGGIIGFATACTLDIKSSRALGPVIGSKYSPDVFDGTCIITGQLSAYFSDNTLLAKFIAETPSSLVLIAAELGGSVTTGRRMVFTLPNIKYVKSQKAPKDLGGVVQDLPFEALYDIASGTTIQIDRYL